MQFGCRFRIWGLRLAVGPQVDWQLAALLSPRNRTFTMFMWLFVLQNVSPLPYLAAPPKTTGHMRKRQQNW